MTMSPMFIVPENRTDEKVLVERGETILNIPRCQKHNPDYACAEDCILNKIQESQTGRRLQAGNFVLLQVVVIACGLKRFVREVLKQMKAGYS